MKLRCASAIFDQRVLKSCNDIDRLCLVQC